MSDLEQQREPRRAAPLGYAGAALRVGGLVVWYLVSRHVGALMLGGGIALFGLETAIERHSPGGARFVEVKGPAAVVLGIALVLVGMSIVVCAVLEWILPGSALGMFARG